MNGNGQEWGAWLQDVVKSGLTARWDAETLEKFGVARQTPAQPVGTGAASQLVPQEGAPMVSPLVLLGGAAARALGLFFVLRD
jgi:hypothetical protein